MAKIGVIGAGVMGVVGASELQRRGHEVTILTHQPPNKTLSQTVPPAIVFPCVAEWTAGIDQIEGKGLNRLCEWESNSLKRFRDLANVKGSGISSCAAVMIFDRYVGETPYWRPDYPDFRIANSVELPQGSENGWLFTTYVVDTRQWIGQLLRHFKDDGGHLTILNEPLQSLLRATQERSFDAWLVCPGLRARQLFPEDTNASGYPNVYGSRGHLVEVRTNPTVARKMRHALIHAPERVEFRDKNTFVYIVPIHDDRGDFGTGHFILGGTMEPVTEEELFLKQEPDQAICERIVENCKNLMPQLQDAEVIGQRVGIRPCRTGGIRIERDTSFPYEVPVIAAYGTGSDGISVHACMFEAVELIEHALYST